MCGPVSCTYIASFLVRIAISLSIGLQGCDGCGELGAVLNMGGAPYRHLGKLGCVRSDPYEPTSTGIGVGRGGAATHLCVEITSFRVDLGLDSILYIP